MLRNKLTLVLLPTLLVPLVTVISCTSTNSKGEEEPIKEPTYEELWDEEEKRIQSDFDKLEQNLTSQTLAFANDPDGSAIETSFYTLPNEKFKKDADIREVLKDDFGFDTSLLKAYANNEYEHGVVTLKDLKYTPLYIDNGYGELIPKTKRFVVGRYNQIIDTEENWNREHPGQELELSQVQTSWAINVELTMKESTMKANLEGLEISKTFNWEVYGFRETLLSLDEWAREYDQSRDDILLYSEAYFTSYLDTLKGINWFEDRENNYVVDFLEYNDKMEEYFSWPDLGLGKKIGAFLYPFSKKDFIFPNNFTLPPKLTFLNRLAFRDTTLPINFTLENTINFLPSAFRNAHLQEGFTIEKGASVLENHRYAYDGSTFIAKSQWEEELDDPSISVYLEDIKYTWEMETWNLPPNTHWEDEEGNTLTSLEEAISDTPNKYTSATLMPEHPELLQYQFIKTVKLVSD